VTAACRGGVSDTSRAAGQRPEHTESLRLPSRLERVTPHTPPTRVATVLAVLVVALAFSSGATAAPPCADAILADWLDNSRIDRLYDLPCYEAAIDAIPPDLRDYTDAADVIARAFQSASGRRLEGRRLEGPSTDPSPPDEVPGVDASASTSVPIPLLVLGGMSVMLLAAGGVAYVARRRREHGRDD
jgi:hypothetical protein